MKRIALKDIEDTTEFGRGTRFRQYKIGLNVNNEDDDYYEYMLVEIPGEIDYFLLTCVEGYKSGIALAMIKKSKDKNVTTGETMKSSFGIKNTYLIEY